MSAGLFLMLHFPSSKEYGYLHLVIAQEFQAWVVFVSMVVVARFGPDRNLLTFC